MINPTRMEQDPKSSRICAPPQPSAKCFSWTNRFLWKQQARKLVWRSSKNLWSTGNDRGPDLAQGRRILMFIIHNIKLLLDIFRDADPGRRWANKRGSARGRGNSVNRRKRSCWCALHLEKTVKSRGFLGQCSWWCSLGQLCTENQVAVLSLGTVNK